MIWRFWEPEHVKLLRKSKALIKDPKRWCKRAYMYDTLTDKAHAADAQRLQDPTVQFCAAGSLLANAGQTEHGSVNLYDNDDPTGYLKSIDALNTAALDMPVPKGYSIMYVNDNLGHKAVMDMYDQAIKIAKKS